jgi:nucleotide-binding universal stress UspA family protein
MYQKILVPLDGSDVAEKTLPHAEALAERFDARLIFLQVLDPVPHVVTNVVDKLRREGYDLERKEAESYLSDKQKGLADKGIESATVVRHGPPFQAILDVATEQDVDLIAMGSHGSGGLSSAFYGSVASAVLHRVDRPLLLIRSVQKDIPKEV